MQRNGSDNYNVHRPILFPIRPYHQRWAEYLQKRNAIFEISDISTYPVKRSKRSTIRLRRYYRQRKICSKYLISSIVNDPQDQRLYAKVSFLNFVERGLLDTGANVSCLGGDLALYDFSSYKEFHDFKSCVKTADGKRQKVRGYLDVEIKFRNRYQHLRILIVPSLSQRLILG